MTKMYRQLPSDYESQLHVKVSLNQTALQYVRNVAYICGLVKLRVLAPLQLRDPLAHQSSSTHYAINISVMLEFYEPK